MMNMNSVFWMTVYLVMVLCLASRGKAQEEEHLAPPTQDEEEWHSPPPEEDETEVFPTDEEGEDWNAPFDVEEGTVQSSLSRETVFEEDLPTEDAFSDPLEEERPIIHGVEPIPPTQLSPSFSSPEVSSLPSPGDGVSPEAIPTPAENPPFMSRPLEWETAPPTVIGTPPLPSASAFSDRELVAFKFIQEGKEYFDREEWKLAQELFERAISVAPFVPYSYYFLGRIAFSRGELKPALAFLQKAELLFPRSDHAWIGEAASIKGTVYEELNDYKQARASYRRSLHFQPANLKVLSALARLPEEEPDLSVAIPQ